MQFEIAYELAAPNAWAAFWPALMSAIVGLVGYRVASKRSWHGRLQGGFLALAIAPLILGLADYGGSYIHYKRLVSAVSAGQAITISGDVQEFQPYQSLGRRRFTPEGFTVSGHRFEKTANSIWYPKSAVNGGELRNGQTVRITYVGNDIVKLEFSRWQGQLDVVGAPRK